jgi:hypothetical protein
MEGKQNRRGRNIIIALSAGFVLLGAYALYFVVMFVVLPYFVLGNGGVTVGGGAIVLFATTVLIAVTLACVICAAVCSYSSSDSGDEDSGGGGINIRRWPYSPPPRGGGLATGLSGGLSVETRYVSGRPVTVVLAPRLVPQKAPAYN